MDAAFSRAFAASVEKTLTASQRRALVDRSAGLIDWGRAYLPQHFSCQPSTMHRWIAEKVHAARRERNQRINIVGPRGGAKSTIGTLANILRCAVEGTEPYIWILSESADQAVKHLADIKLELEENTQLARDYPEACGKGRIWRSNSIRLRNNVVIEAHGMGSAIRGKKNRQDRPTLIVCDDLQDPKCMLSADLRKKHWDWLQSTVLKAGDHRTNIVNLANAYHREAIGLRLCETPGWSSQVFSAIAKWPSDMGLWEQWAEIYCDMALPDPDAAARQFYDLHRSAMDAGAELLWPERESLYFLMCMWVVDRGAFEREKQSRPVNPADCEWPESYFDDRIWFEEWPRSWRVKTLALDPSKGRDARRSDYSAFVSLLVGTDGYLYVDADLARRDVSQIVTDGVELYRNFQPDAFGIEGNAWQDLLGDYFVDEFAKQGMHDARPWTLDNSTNKVVRIRSLGGYLSQRRIRFKAGSPGTRLLVSQLRDFPDKHSHDDGPDALEMADRLARRLLSGDNDIGPDRIEV